MLHKSLCQQWYLFLLELLLDLVLSDISVQSRSSAKHLGDQVTVQCCFVMYRQNCSNIALHRVCSPHSYIVWLIPALLMTSVVDGLSFHLRAWRSGFISLLVCRRSFTKTFMTLSASFYYMSFAAYFCCRNSVGFDGIAFVFSSLILCCIEQLAICHE